MNLLLLLAGACRPPNSPPNKLACILAPAGRLEGLLLLLLLLHLALLLRFACLTKLLML
jgi:hypothetical protein